MPVRARRATVVLVALFAAAAICGCGGHSDRDSVRAYITAANAIQSDGSADLAKVNAAYARVSRGKTLGVAGIAELQDGVDRLRATRARLARLATPAPAAGLRTRLLVVFDRTIDMADEATLVVSYVRASSTIMGALSGLGAALSHHLAQSASAAARGEALKTYGDRLAGLEARLRQVSPPDVLLAAHRSQLLRLHSARGLARRLRLAIGRSDAAATAELLLRFRTVYASSGVDARVERAAVRTYRERVSGVQQAIAAVQRERARLAGSLG